MTTRAPLDGFEAALLAELREHVSARQPASTRPALRRRIVAVGAALGAALAVTAGGLALRPDAAFAVDPQSDGDVVVTISSLKDADGLERALAAEGIDAEVDYSAEPLASPAPDGSVGGLDSSTDKADGPTLDQHRSDHAPEPAGVCGEVPSAAEREEDSVSVERAGDGVTFTLSHSFVDSDAAISITTSGQDDGPAGIMVQVTRDCAPGEGGMTKLP